MKKFPIPNVIFQFSKIFHDNGFLLYVVGGAVRDYLLGIDNHDYDFCTDALPEQVVSIFKHTIPTGIKHGTVTVLFKGSSFEVTTFRTESDYLDGRHPNSVNYVRSLQEDLSRRDFTINAFAADCSSGEIIDLYDGIDDLNKKLIKAIGNPSERFSEDALRLMRMARFCSKLNFDVEEETLIAAKSKSCLINKISFERIFDELYKMLSTPNPVKGLKLLEESGIMNEILPELISCKSIVQCKLNASNVLEHIYNSLNAAVKLNYGIDVRLALLFHDVGKPVCIKHMQQDVICFTGHEIIGAKIAENVLRRLKCSNKIIDKTKILISNHMIRYESSWTDGAVKRFINRVGKENINDLFELQWCDQIASEGKAKIEEYDELIERIKNLQHEPLNLKDLAITGNELFDIGIPKGKNMGIILNALLDFIIDNPSCNNKETLIEYSLKLYNNILGNGQ